MFDAEARGIEDLGRIEPEQPPAEVDKLLEVKVLAKSALLLYILNQPEVVGADVHLKLRRLLTRGVEGSTQLGIELLQIARLLLVLHAAERGAASEVVLRDEGNAEELVAEGHPV